MRRPHHPAPQTLACSSRPPLELSSLTGCFRSPISLSDLDLTSHHQQGPPTRHTRDLKWVAVPGSSRLFLCLVTGFVHCIC